MSPERLIPEAAPRSDLLERHLARYRFASTLVRGASVLDVACGSGYGSDLLSQEGAASVIGVDIADEAIRHAETRYQRPNLRFVRAEAEQVHELGAFDRIISFETIEHLADPPRFLRSVGRALKPQGTFVVSTPRRSIGLLTDRPMNPFHLREWDEVEFRSLLSSHFRSVDMLYQCAFESLGFPGSRTIQALAARVVYSDGMRRAGRYTVVRQCPAMPAFRFEPAYLLAVCQQPILSGTLE